MTFARANTDQLRLFAKELKSAAPSVNLRLRRELRETAAPIIMDQARENLFWSKKIPRTLRSRIRGLTVTIIAGFKTVPIARWYEKGRTNKSPLWTHPAGVPHVGFDSKRPRRDWKWVHQRDPSRPYLKPALDERKGEVARRIVDALVNTIVDMVHGAKPE